MSRQWESKKGSNKEINVKFEKEGDAVEGFLMETLTEQGSEGKSSIHILKSEDGKTEHVFWGSMVIDDQLAKVDFGNYVMVKFLGKVKAKKGPFSYNDFEVLEDTATEGVEVEAPAVKVEETTLENAVDVTSDDEEDDLPF